MTDPWIDLVWRVGVTVVTSVVGVVVTLTANAYWQRLLGARLRQAAAKYALEHGRLEVALVLSVLHEIRQSALAYLEKNNCKGIQVFQVHQKEGFGDREEHWAAYLEKVKTEVRRMRDLGASRIYLFTNIPVAMATFAGATLANGPEVIVHHFAAGVYYPVGRLTVETVRL